jgi:hypothetical protein
LSTDIEHLYKYRSLSGDSSRFVERLLLHDELYFCRPAEFNDPFDCCPVLTLKATRKELATYIDGLYKSQRPGLSRADRRRNVSITLKNLDRKSKNDLDAMNRAAMIEAVNSAGVLSLSAKHDHILMWSHYADSHRGICLRFKSSSSTPFFGRAQRVLYQAARPVLDLIHDSKHTQADKALLTKADLWSYEEEWRVIEHDLGSGVHKFPAKLLDALIFGARISSEDREKVLQWIALRKTKMEVLQSQIDAERFRLEIAPELKSLRASVIDRNQIERA